MLGCRNGAGQKDVGSARSVGVGVTMPRHLGARRVLLEPPDKRDPELTVAAHVREVVAAELVSENSVNNRTPTVAEGARLVEARQPRGWRVSIFPALGRLAVIVVVLVCSFGGWSSQC